MPNALTNIPGPSETASQVLDIIAVIGFVAAALLSLLSTDFVCRKIFNPVTLFSKRVKGARYLLKKKILSGLDEYNDSIKLLNTEHLDKFIACLFNEEDSIPIIIGIHRDDETRDYFIILDCRNHKEYGNLIEVRVPLIKFCDKLAEKYEQIVSKSSFCFVGDASAGLGPLLLSKLLEASTEVIVLTPKWIGIMALLIERKIFTVEEFDNVIFALSRLEAARWSEYRTVVIIFPGQAFVPALLPTIARVFPNERHVFMYDDCCTAVQRSLRAKKLKTGDYSQSVEMCRAAVGSSMESSLKDYKLKLSQLTGSTSNAVYSWMCSIDAFLNLKNNEDDIKYDPFVMRLDAIFRKVNELDSNELKLSIACNASISNLLQFVIGSQLRPFESDLLNSAINANLDALCGLQVRPFFPFQSKAIEACIFCLEDIHHREKTLIEAVQSK